MALVAVGTRGTQDAVANGDTRTLTFHHSHTGESITITYKRDGRYDEDALKKLNWFMRDWRRNESTRMDPHLFDVVWEVYRDVDARAPVEIVSAYRAPATNAMLRSRGRGVAQFSQHTIGKAIDLFIPGVSLSAIREAGLRLQRGGVGFYPTSGSPFVHLDTASVRHWPRMSRDQLARVFPDGKTVHLPADGRPLSGYDIAARQLEQRGGSVRGRTILAARVEPEEDSDMSNDGRVVFRSRGSTATASAAAAPRKSLFAWLAGESETNEAPPARTAPAAAPVTLAQAPAPASVPLPEPRPVSEPAVAQAPQATPPLPPVAVRPYESTISVARAEAPGAFAAAPPATARPAGAPLPPARPGRTDTMEVAQAAAVPWPVNRDTTASIAPLPPVITSGEASPPSAQILAYAVPGETTIARAVPAKAAASAGRVPVPAPQRRAASVREPQPRLAAPRPEGPGLPRLITAVRFDVARLDMRHPDAAGASQLLRGTGNVVDVRFTRAPVAEPAADHFAGPAIRLLPVARFEVAALGGNLPSGLKN